MAVTQATVGAYGLTLKRCDDEVRLGYADETGARFIVLPWADLCRLPGLVDDMRRIFGEPTAMDH